MAALAYLLPPVSGLVVYLWGSTERVRFHGLQSVVLGFLWPALSFLAAMITPGLTQLVFGAGALTWLVFLAVTALGKDARLPGGAWLRRLAEQSPRYEVEEEGGVRAEPRSTSDTTSPSSR